MQHKGGGGKGGSGEPDLPTGRQHTLSPAAAFVNCHPVFPKHSNADPVCVVIGGL